MRDVLGTGHGGVWPRLGVALDGTLLTEVLDAFEVTLMTVIEPYPSAIEVLARIRAHGIATAIVSINDELPDGVPDATIGSLAELPALLVWRR